MSLGDGTLASLLPLGRGWHADDTVIVNNCECEKGEEEATFPLRTRLSQGRPQPPQRPPTTQQADVADRQVDVLGRKQGR